ncbi:hypothetical protein DRO34_06210, partial [Candidatus Bathyarchaeota archaeon]
MAAKSIDFRFHSKFLLFFMLFLTENLEDTFMRSQFSMFLRFSVDRRVFVDAFVYEVAGVRCFTSGF